MYSLLICSFVDVLSKPNILNKKIVKKINRDGCDRKLDVMKKQCNVWTKTNCGRLLQTTLGLPYFRGPNSGHSLVSTSSF